LLLSGFDAERSRVVQVNAGTTADQRATAANSGVSHDDIPLQTGPATHPKNRRAAQAQRPRGRRPPASQGDPEACASRWAWASRWPRTASSASIHPVTSERGCRSSSISPTACCCTPMPSCCLDGARGRRGIASQAANDGEAPVLRVVPDQSTATSAVWPVVQRESKALPLLPYCAYFALSAPPARAHRSTANRCVRIQRSRRRCGLGATEATTKRVAGTLAPNATLARRPHAAAQCW